MIGNESPGDEADESASTWTADIGGSVEGNAAIVES